MTDDGATIDSVAPSSVVLGDLTLQRGAPIRVRIGLKPDAAHLGGVNLFGRRFGAYHQGIGLRLEYEAGSSSNGRAAAP